MLSARSSGASLARRAAQVVRETGHHEPVWMLIYVVANQGLEFMGRRHAVSQRDGLATTVARLAAKDAATFAGIVRSARSE